MFGPLVVGRANGNIEIYEWTGSAVAAEAPQAWVLRKVREYSLSLSPHID
jgi:U3 small nucleolar RNA-associated protein 4